MDAIHQSAVAAAPPGASASAPAARPEGGGADHPARSAPAHARTCCCMGRLVCTSSVTAD